MNKGCSAGVKLGEGSSGLVSHWIKVSEVHEVPAEGRPVLGEGDGDGDLLRIELCITRTSHR